jgi:hypothetical protein
MVMQGGHNRGDIMSKTLSITALDEDFQATVAALCHAGNYQAGDPLEFAKGVLLDFLGNVRSSHARFLARQKVDELQRQIDAAIEAGNASARKAVVLSVEESQ